jgi:hypothetical protein
MANRLAERPALRLFHINMNPLPVLSYIGKFVDPVLVDGYPFVCTLPKKLTPPSIYLLSCCAIHPGNVPLRTAFYIIISSIAFDYLFFWIIMMNGPNYKITCASNSSLLNLPPLTGLYVNQIYKATILYHSTIQDDDTRQIAGIINPPRQGHGHFQ